MTTGRSISLTSSSNVLITGVTGLIGGEIFRRLATSVTGGNLWPVIRPTADRSPAERLTQRLARSGADCDLPLNIRAVPGDVLREGWGLESDDLAMIRESVDIIIHNAADTSFASERAPEATNIEGTRRLIDLARSCERTPLIVYMGTASNVGRVNGRCVAEEDGCRADNRHYNEYTRSKAIAETLLRESGLPVLTLRPTIVLSAGLPDGQFARQILWCVPITRLFESLPLNPDARIDIVDVGFVAESTLRLMADPDREHDCYHLSAGPGGSVALGTLVELVNRHYKRATPLRALRPSDWTPSMRREAVGSEIQRNIFRSLKYYLPFLNMDVVYDDTRLARQLGPDRPTPLPVESYLCDLLRLIRTQTALKEAALP
jgi:nucleoside-diphosphate-sugar epimerase